MSDFSKIFAENVHRELKKRGKNQSWLSKEAKISSGTLSDILNGGNPKLDSIVKISRALGVEPSGMINEVSFGSKEVSDKTLLLIALGKKIQEKGQEFEKLKLRNDVSAEELDSLVLELQSLSDLIDKTRSEVNSSLDKTHSLIEAAKKTPGMAKTNELLTLIDRLDEGQLDDAIAFVSGLLGETALDESETTRGSRLK